MIDSFEKVKGYIRVEVLDKDKNVQDMWEQDNLIMDEARRNMSELIAGSNTALKMNKFVLGTAGHQGTNILLPKDSTTGFIPSRLNLFSEEAFGFTYPIVWTVSGVSGVQTVVSEPDTGSTVSLLKTALENEYTIEIPLLAANDTGTVIYTEAALYATNRIFSMKCFPAKIKDNSVSLRVVWKITF